MLAGGEDPLYIAAPADPRRGRGYRPRRSAGAGAGARRLGRLRPARLARGRAGAGAVRDLSRDRAEIERRLRGVRRGASATARETGSLMPPMHILNAPTRLMKDLGYGKGYVYDHATEEGFSGQNYFPDGMARAQFLPADRARLRARDQEAARLLGEAAREEGARRQSRVTLPRFPGLSDPIGIHARNADLAAVSCAEWTCPVTMPSLGSPLVTGSRGLGPVPGTTIWKPSFRVRGCKIICRRSAKRPRCSPSMLNAISSPRCASDSEWK